MKPILTGRFRARRADDGRIIEILKYAYRVSADTFEGSSEELGFTSFWTKDGGKWVKVYPVGPGEFELVLPTPVRVKQI